MSMSHRTLGRVLVAHGFITLAAAIVLVARPALIPSAVGIHLDANAYLLAYLLAGAELGFAVLSFGASRLATPQALRLVLWSCIAFHVSSSALEAYACSLGTSTAILGNVAARLIIVGVFADALRSL